MIDERHLNGTTGESKSYTVINNATSVINNGNATSSVTNLYYEQLQEQSDRDYVEVVRCKDCRHAGECHKSVQYSHNESNTVTIGYSPIEWCSRGERREDG